MHCRTHLLVYLIKLSAVAPYTKKCVLSYLMLVSKQLPWRSLYYAKKNANSVCVLYTLISQRAISNCFLCLSQDQCVPGSMCPRTEVSQNQSVPGPKCPRTKVCQDQCVPFQAHADKKGGKLYSGHGWIDRYVCMDGYMSDCVCACVCHYVCGCAHMCAVPPRWPCG